MEKGVRKVARVDSIEFYFEEGYLGIKRDGKEFLSSFKMKDSNERTQLLETINNLIK